MAQEIFITGRWMIVTWHQSSSFQVQERCKKNWINIELFFKVPVQTVPMIFNKCITFFEVKAHH